MNLRHSPMFSTIIIDVIYRQKNLTVLLTVDAL